MPQRPSQVPETTASPQTASIGRIIAKRGLAPSPSKTSATTQPKARNGLLVKGLQSATPSKPKAPHDPKREKPANWEVKRRSDGWYLTGIPFDCQEDGEYGPYSSREELNDDRRGLVRFLTIDQFAEPTE